MRFDNTLESSTGSRCMQDMYAGDVQWCSPRPTKSRVGWGTTDGESWGTFSQDAGGVTACGVA